jgi:hypothetical protein
MNTRRMFVRVVARRFLDRINKIDRIKKGAAFETLCTNDSRLFPRARRAITVRFDIIQTDL